MSINDDYQRAADDLDYDEYRAFSAHLLGGLLQQIEVGMASKRAAAAAIARAREFATRARVSA